MTYVALQLRNNNNNNNGKQMTAYLSEDKKHALN